MEQNFLGGKDPHPHPPTTGERQERHQFHHSCFSWSDAPQPRQGTKRRRDTRQASRGRYA